MKKWIPFDEYLEIRWVKQGVAGVFSQEQRVSAALLEAATYPDVLVNGAIKRAKETTEAAYEKEYNKQAGI